MRYMMLIHHDEAAMQAADQKQLWADYGAFNEALAKAAGADGGGVGARLQPLARGHADPSLVQGFVEGAVLGPELLLGRSGECGFVVVDQHHVTHRFSPMRSPEHHAPA